MRLWNAHQRVILKRKLPLQRLLRLEKKIDGWRQILSEDVIKYIDDLDMENLAGSAEERNTRITTITRNPAMFFSRPKNVPLEMRKQVYLPDFVVTLIRTPQLPPKYASFWVPLWFNKLDFKNYLRNVYDVDVLHVRSYVQQQKVARDQYQRGTKVLQGPIYRPPARKKMTVELVDPFVYPEEQEDLSAWESEIFKREEKELDEMSKENSKAVRFEPNTKARRSIAEQAQDFLQGKQKWKPSWQSIPADAKIIRNTSRPPGIRATV